MWDGPPNAWLLGCCCEIRQLQQPQEVRDAGGEACLGEGGKRPESISRVPGTAWSGSPTAEPALACPGEASDHVRVGAWPLQLCDLRRPRGPRACFLTRPRRSWHCGSSSSWMPGTKEVAPSFMEYLPCARCYARCLRAPWGQSGPWTHGADVLGEVDSKCNKSVNIERGRKRSLLWGNVSRHGGDGHRGRWWEASLR